MGLVQRRFFLITLAVWISAAGLIASADVLTLKDGSMLQCEVLSDAAQSSQEFIQIRANNSVVWISRNAVAKIEKKPLPDDSADETVEAILKRLTDEGTIMWDVPGAGGTATGTPAQADFDVKIKDVRGWIYQYENYIGNKQERKALQAGDTVPPKYDVRVSPNSRATLTIGKSGVIGIEGNTQVRFDTVQADRSTFRIELRIEQGKAWFRAETEQGSWRNLIVEVNAVRTVLKQRSVMYVEAGERTGSVNITYIDGSGELSFWRSNNDRFPLQVGELMIVSPNTMKPEIIPRVDVEDLKTRVQNWQEWKPQPLPITFGAIIPPLETFPPFGTIPALHPHRIVIDHTMLLPPITYSLGEVLQIYRKAIEQYKYDTGRFPSNEHGLQALVESYNVGSWRGPYVPLDLPLRDLWGSKYVYETFRDQGRVIYDVRSMGPNKRDDRGLEDDIR